MLHVLQHFGPVSTLLLSLLLLTACGVEEDPAEELLPSEKSVCDGEAIESEYLVQWADGSLTTVKNSNREAFKEDFVRPNLEKIRRIEFNQKFRINKDEIRVRNVDVIDNWGFRDTNVSSLWQAGHRGSGIVVAVIDSGVDLTHEKLESQIYELSGEIPGNNLDDDGNGYIDDHRGYDFYGGSPDITDRLFHGTHVAGTIAAQHDLDTEEDEVVLGMAPAAKIMPLKFIDTDGGTLSAAIEAINYAANNGAKIINASWGGSGCSSILRERVLQLADEGILFVAASGNSGNNLDRFPEFPAAFRGTQQLTVGSITQFGGMSVFSNYSQDLVHLFAPGSDIVSTVPDNGIMGMSGTSMATPFVAGAAALIWGANPNLSMIEVRQILLQSVSVDDRFRNITQGKIDLSLSLQFL